MLSVDIKEQYESLKQEMGRVIAGQDEVISMMIIAFLAGGHLLLEGVPGTAKTLMVKTLSRLLGVDFKRVQFTPDLMPSDITGNNVFDMATTTFNLRQGPVFTDFLLADEINRTPPKTQAALLECMEEQQVTIDGVEHRLPAHFTVFATQNPLEYEGTYPLPEAQLDRFLGKVLVDYPSAVEEREILRRYGTGFDLDALENETRPVLSPGEIVTLKAEIVTVKIEDKLFDYINQVVRATRDEPNCLLGASPRAAVHLLLTARAAAAVAGRDYVIPDDIKRLAPPILRHRLILKPEAELDGITPDDVIDAILEGIEIPR